MSYQITLNTELLDSDDENNWLDWLLSNVNEEEILTGRWSARRLEDELYDRKSLYLRVFVDWDADVETVVETLKSEFEAREWLIIESQERYDEYRQEEWRDDPQEYPPDMAVGLRTNPAFDCESENELCVSSFDYRHNDTNKSSDKQKLKVEPVDNWRDGVVVIDDDLEIITSDPKPNTEMLSKPDVDSTMVTVGTLRIPPNERELRNLRPATQYQQPGDRIVEYEHGVEDTD